MGLDSFGFKLSYAADATLVFADDWYTRGDSDFELGTGRTDPGEPIRLDQLRRVRKALDPQETKLPRLEEPPAEAAPLLGIPLPDPGNYYAFFLRKDVAAQIHKPLDAEGGFAAPDRGRPEEVAGVQASQGILLR
jgi:hypothetical protein